MPVVGTEMGTPCWVSGSEEDEEVPWVEEVDSGEVS